MAFFSYQSLGEKSYHTQKTMVFGNRSLVDNAAVAMASMSMNSDYKETNVAIVKATDHTEGAPKEKHVQSTSSNISGAP